MQENSSIKDKILFYLNFKGITKYKFYKDTGITRGILDQKNGITEDNLLKFLKYAQDISLEWLLFGKGELLKNLKEEIPKSSFTIKDSESPYYELYEKQKNEIKQLNREIGKLELIIDHLKKVTSYPICLWLPNLNQFTQTKKVQKSQNSAPHTPTIIQLNIY